MALEMSISYNCNKREQENKEGTVLWDEHNLALITGTNLSVADIASLVIDEDNHVGIVEELTGECKRRVFRFKEDDSYWSGCNSVPSRAVIGILNSTTERYKDLTVWAKSGLHTLRWVVGQDKIDDIVLDFISSHIYNGEAEIVLVGQFAGDANITPSDELISDAWDILVSQAQALMFQNIKIGGRK